MVFAVMLILTVPGSGSGSCGLGLGSPAPQPWGTPIIPADPTPVILLTGRALTLYPDHPFPQGLRPARLQSAMALGAVCQAPGDVPLGLGQLVLDSPEMSRRPWC